MRLNLTFFITSLILATAVPSIAQTAVFRGRIVDPLHAAVGGALVSAVPEGRGTPATAASDETGAFALQLDHGTYTVTVRAPGFADLLSTVNVPAAGLSAVEFVLQLAGFTQSVEVAGK